MRKNTLLLALFLCAVSAGSFAAYDQTVWQNTSSYTYQEWNFDTAEISNYVTGTTLSYVEVADTYINPFSTSTLAAPTMTITNVDSFTWKDEFYGHQGVWAIARYEHTDMYIDIPNDAGNTGEGTWKEMRIEIVYNYDMDPDVYPDGDTMFSFFGTYEVDYEVVSNIDLGDNWYVATYDIIIEPNPEWERIYIMPDECMTYVDSIVIETVCIPEPASMLLLGCGITLLRRKK